jgi:ABC-2 type transport system ATP-binding protein
MQVRVDNLARYYGRTRAVDGVSFAFESGHIIAFVGPNGAGKTTTLRLLATMEEPTAGDAFLDGVSVTQDPEQVRRWVGFMPDYLPAHRDITVHEYLDFYARAYGIHGKRRQALVAEVEAFANLGGMREKTIRALSKGMKQRVSLARAVVHDPEVLLLDEPAAGLDPRARVELRELLQLLAQQGKAILVSSHILTELSEICDGAIIIERGRVVRAGTTNELVAAATPRRLLRIRSLDGLERIHKTVLEMPAVETARIAGPYLEVMLDGDEAACHRLLADLIGLGLPVVEFTHEKTNLETIFMDITKGQVQ